MNAKLEKTIEAKVVTWARSAGILVRKMNGMGFNAWPDRMFLYAGRAVFIEFKKPGGKATPLQTTMHDALRHHDFEVEVFSDANVAILWLQEKFSYTPGEVSRL